MQGPLYGQMLVADFIGTERGLRVAALQPNSQGITAYAGYLGGRVARVVLVNTHERKAGGGGAQQDIKLPASLLAGGGGGDITVKASRVTGPASDSPDGITYAGLDWAGDGNPELVGKEPDTLRPGPDGSVTVTVGASEAVLLTW